MIGDVTVVINAHQEGLLINPTLMSVSRSRNYARLRGHNVELIVVLDRSDKLTSEIVQSWDEPEYRILSCDNGDPGLSRNMAVNIATSEWIAFMDGDDICCKTWLSDALDLAIRDPREIVWHPEFSLYFGLNPYILKHIDMESKEFDSISLLLSNYWTVLCMARRQLLHKVCYSKTQIDKQIGYEDWAWNIAAIREGAIHKIVPRTSHAIRQKMVSQGERANARSTLPIPTPYFREQLSKLNIGVNYAKVEKI